MMFSSLFFFELYGDHRDLHVLTHVFPTRRSSCLQYIAFGDRSGWIGGNDDSANRFPQPAVRHSDHGCLPHPRMLLDDEFDLTRGQIRSEEHTSELQSLMRISYAVFCLKKKLQLKPHMTEPCGTHTNIQHRT